VSIAEKHERTMALITPLEICESYFVNQREENPQLFWWSPNPGFQLTTLAEEEVALYLIE